MTTNLFDSLADLLSQEIALFHQDGAERLVSHRLDGLEYRVGLHRESDSSVTLEVQFLDGNTGFVVHKRVHDEDLQVEWEEVTAKNMADMAIAKYELSKGGIAHIKSMIENELSKSSEYEQSSVGANKAYFSGKVGVLLWLSEFLKEVEG